MAKQAPSGDETPVNKSQAVRDFLAESHGEAESGLNPDGAAVKACRPLPGRARPDAARDGSEVVATYLWDKEAILTLVAGRERDVGGEG